MKTELYENVRMFCVILGILLTSFTSTIAQTSITLGAIDISDATIRLDQRVGMEYIGSTNYGTLTRLAATAWTASGVRTYARTLIYFNLNTIPQGATIQSATLFLYSDPIVTGSVEVGIASSIF